MSVRLYKKGNRYYAEWYDANRLPKKKYTALKTGDKKAAKRKLQRLEVEFIDGKFDPWNPVIEKEGARRKRLRRLDTGVDAFLKTKRHLAKKSQKNYEHVLGLLTEKLGGRRDVRLIDPEDIADFLDNGDRNKTSQQTYLTHVAAFFRWLTLEGVIERNPCKKVKVGKKQKVRVVKAIQSDELEAITDLMRRERGNVLHTDPTTVDLFIRMFWVTFYLGLRAREVSHAKWTWVDWEHGVFRIPNDDEFAPKAKEEQKVRIVQPAREILLELREEQGESDGYLFPHPDGGRIPCDWISKMFKRWARRALPEHRAETVSLHSLRHGACVHILKATGNIEVAREHLRHSDISVTQVYARFTDEMYSDVLTSAFA